MAAKQKNSGFVILFRAPNRWHVFAEGVTPQDLEDTVRRCKLATMSVWIRWEPRVVADWLIANPTREDKMPRRILVAAKKAMDQEQKTLERGMDYVRGMVIGLEQKIRPTQREVRQAQKAAASRRKK